MAKAQELSGLSGGKQLFYVVFYGYVLSNRINHIIP